MQIPVAIGVVGSQRPVLVELVGTAHLEVVHIVGHVGVAVGRGELDIADVVAQTDFTVHAAAIFASNSIPPFVSDIAGKFTLQHVAGHTGFTVEVQTRAERGKYTDTDAGDRHAVVAVAARGVFSAAATIEIGAEALGEIQAQTAKITG